MNTQNVVFHRTLVGKEHVTYLTHVSLDPGVSGDMVKVSSTIHQALSAGITPVSRQFLVYQIHVPIQSTSRDIRARTLRTIKSPAITTVLHLDVTPQVASPIELGPTLSTRVCTALMFVATSFEVWISRGRSKVLALITIVSMSSPVADSGTIGGHLANTQGMLISSLYAEKLL